MSKPAAGALASDSTSFTMGKMALGVGTTLMVLVLSGALAFSVLRPVVVLPRMAAAPSYGLVDQHNRWLLDTDLRGQIVLYSFTYTGCTGSCPASSPVLRAAQDRLAASSDLPPVTLLSISFDPARDTPAALDAYAQRVGADPLRWRFATGSPTELKTLIGAGFRAFYQAQPDGSYTFDPVFVLVDGEGTIRAEYRMAKPDIDTILRDVRLIADETRNSHGAQRYVYEAAHLFVCYPR